MKNAVSASTHKKFPLLPTIVLMAVALPVILMGGSRQATTNDGRPARGSVNFGARSAPQVNVSPAMREFSTVFADVAEKVVPTVVSVIPTKIDTITFTNNPFYRQFPEGWEFFEDFFGGGRRRGGPQQPQQPQRQERRQQGLGSGVIVSSDGYILTNSHVVSGAAEIEVKMSDGRSFTADLVGADSLTDVAVLKISERVNNLPVAFLGDSDKLRPGDWAMAIGNPFSLTSSVTVGIVSAVGRATPMPGSRGAAFTDFIQTDAAINPGNSGGALVNIDGALVGINTMIYTQSGGNMGIGFAIPINMARRIMEDLIYDGKVSRGWLGVSIQELDRAMREAFGLRPETKGVLVGDVFPNQPAYNAGIRRGDVITKIGDREIETLNQLRNQIATLRPGQTVPIEFLRGNRRQTVRVTVASREESEQLAAAGGGGAARPEGEVATSNFMGMTVGAMSPDIRARLNFPANLSGVVVTDVERGSVMAQEGIRANDVILEVNRTAVASPADYARLTGRVGSGSIVLFSVWREGNMFFRPVRVR